MEHFIREYALRSILPHLNTPAGFNNFAYTTGNEDVNSADNNSNNIIINSSGINTNSSNTSSSDSNIYYIAPQQQLLNNNDYSENPAGYNDTTTAALLILGTAAVSSTLETITAAIAGTTATTEGDTYYQPYIEEGEAGAEDHTNFLRSFCDGESLSVSAMNASSTNSSSGAESALSSVYFKTAVYLLYIPIFVFALLGNGTVCYIVQSTPRMRTVTNFFIANLAVGDILMSTFCVPFSFVSIFILGYWPFGIALCYLVNYSQAVSVLVSAYTLVAISIDRYIAIMWPLRPRITKRYAKFIIAGVWAIALVTAFPILIVSKLTQPDGWHVLCDRYVCHEEWPSNEQYYYYTLALFTLQFVVPLAVLIFTYTRIALAVWGKRTPGEAENSRDQRMARSKRKMIKMMVMVVIVFTICWLPFNILVLLLNDEEFKLWEPLPYFWFAFHWLAMSHSCYNPIIYCYMNARFRGGFLQIIYRVPGLRRCCCLRRYLHRRGDRSYEATGTDDAFHLQRVNTCTTYISTRRKLRANSMQMSQFSCAETTVLR